MLETFDDTLLGMVIGDELISIEKCRISLANSDIYKFIKLFFREKYNKIFIKNS